MWTRVDGEVASLLWLIWDRVGHGGVVDSSQIDVTGDVYQLEGGGGGRKEGVTVERRRKSVNGGGSEEWLL